MEIRRSGLGGILCVLGNSICEETGQQVMALMEAMREAAVPGVTEMIPAYASLLVRYDPLLTDFETLASSLREAETQSVGKEHAPGREIRIPVCYGGAFGPDLPYVSAYSALTPEEVIALHSGTAYRIYMLGFLPGFPYLGGLDPRLHVPRLEVPRKRIPAGSVGIGGKQTGIYPLDSPGGWRLIGRTPLRLFDPGKPLPYRAGDRIRFEPISPEEYLEMEASHGD